MTIVVIADWLAVRGEEERVAALLADLTAAALAEPGVIAFRALRSQRDPAAFVLLAEYTDQEAAEAHRSGDRYRDLVQGTIAALLIDRQDEVHAPIHGQVRAATQAPGHAPTGAADRTDTPRSTAP